FGGLFVVYIIFRYLYPETFSACGHHLNKVLGGINTVVLICSSLTMALAVDRTRQNDSNKANQYMMITLFCAALFMVIKYVEYSHKIHAGLLPGGFFTFEGLKGDPKAPLFFSLYFMMTGLHGIHVLCGMGLIGWLFFRARRGDFNEGYYTPVELTGLYWHLVDLIWIYLFPLFYLIG
ncbi:MAG: cytochrome c oxidase subunit 3 family protein, partial [bacterium]|nr:cytochrome c oxidase subunit 3 family protein [bacterium]